MTVNFKDSRWQESLNDISIRFPSTIMHLEIDEEEEYKEEKDQNDEETEVGPIEEVDDACFNQFIDDYLHQ